MAGAYSTFARIILAILLLAGTAEAKVKWIDTRNVRPSLPSPTHLTTLPFPQTYILGIPWCFATATMLYSIRVRRELTLGEAYQALGNCFLPIVGGIIVRATWNPAWDLLPTEITRYDPSIKGQ